MAIRQQFSKSIRPNMTVYDKSLPVNVPNTLMAVVEVVMEARIEPLK